MEKVRQHKLLITVLAGLLLLPLLLVFFPRSQDVEKNVFFPTPTAFPSRENIAQPPVEYDTKAADKLMEKIEKREPLSPSDAQAVERLKASLGNGSGVMVSATTFQAEYVKSANQFLVEIRTTDTDRAKTDAALWFSESGVSSDGMCKLPVNFYLERSVAEELRGKNITFSPLPKGCP